MKVSVLQASKEIARALPIFFGTCGTARAGIWRGLGPGGHARKSWESDPLLGFDAVDPSKICDHMQ